MVLNRIQLDPIWSMTSACASCFDLARASSGPFTTPSGTALRTANTAAVLRGNGPDTNKPRPGILDTRAMRRFRTAMMFLELGAQVARGRPRRRGNSCDLRRPA